MIDKQTSLAAAIAAVPAGATLALGGNTLHRAPCAAVHEIVRQGKRGLNLVKTAGAYDVDLLCAAGCAEAVSAGFVGYETPFGLAPAYRRAVETGEVEAREHVCASVIAGLRAASQGVPFMPLAGMDGSDLPAARGFARVADPYGGPPVVAIPAIAPDVAILHVQQADRGGQRPHRRDPLRGRADGAGGQEGRRHRRGDRRGGRAGAGCDPRLPGRCGRRGSGRRLAVLLRRRLRLRRRGARRLDRGGADGGWRTGLY
jgi:acyl CoA:acetate/3-ketoacid CoA transferase alpha subunit